MGDALRVLGIPAIQVQQISSSFARLAYGESTSLWGEHTPALRLTDEGWLNGVRAVASRAELIVADCNGISLGLGSELQCLAEIGR